MTLSVLRPEDGKMVKLIQYDVVENKEIPYTDIKKALVVIKF